MGVRNEWNTYTLGRYSEQPDATKLKATVTQAEKDRVVTQAEKDRVVTQAEKDRVVEQSDHSKLKGTNKITDGTRIATVTPEGYQDVKTHTPEYCFTHDYATEQTDLTIITPTSGKKIQVVSVYASAATDSKNVTIAFVTSGELIFKLYVAKKFSHTGNVICKTGDADVARDKDIKKVLLHIARDEKVHAGEFHVMLLKEDSDYRDSIDEGSREVSKLLSAFK